MAKQKSTSQRSHGTQLLVCKRMAQEWEESDRAIGRSKWAAQNDKKFPNHARSTTFGRRNQICCEQSHFKDDKLEADDRREERMGGMDRLKTPGEGGGEGKWEQ
jgi:hypothetical protein